MSDKKDFNYYVLFPNHHEGLRAHRAFKEAGIKCTISPTPRQLSTSCGISLLLDEEFVEQAQKMTNTLEINTNGIARIEKHLNTKFKSC